MSIELITVANYKTRYPDSALSGINNARIQSAINLAFSYLDVKTGCSISQRWPIQEPTAGYLTAEQKQYCIEAMYVETQYIISNNMDFSQGADQTSFGSLSVSSSRPNRKEVCETALMYLQKAGLYDYLSFSNMSYAGGNQSIGTIGEEEIDPTNKPLPENVSDARYVHKNNNVPNKWLKTNADGQVIFTEYALDPTLYYNRTEISEIVAPLQETCTKLGLGYLKSISRNAVTKTITIKDDLGNAVTFPYGGSGGGGGSGGISDVLVNGVSVVTAGIAEINLVEYATKLELLALLDDAHTSATKTWSSQKIQSMFNTLSGVATISVVDVLPSTLTNNTMYYVKIGESNYAIKMYANNTLYDMGTTQMDFTHVVSTNTEQEISGLKKFQDGTLSTTRTETTNDYKTTYKSNKITLESKVGGVTTSYDVTLPSEAGKLLLMEQIVDSMHHTGLKVIDAENNNRQAYIKPYAFIVDHPTDGLTSYEHGKIYCHTGGSGYTYTLPSHTGTLMTTGDLAPALQNYYTKTEAEAKFLVKITDALEGQTCDDLINEVQNAGESVLFTDVRFTTAESPNEESETRWECEVHRSNSSESNEAHIIAKNLAGVYINRYLNSTWQGWEKYATESWVTWKCYDKSYISNNYYTNYQVDTNFYNKTQSDNKYVLSNKESYVTQTRAYVWNMLPQNVNSMTFQDIQFTTSEKPAEGEKFECEVHKTASNYGYIIAKNRLGAFISNYNNGTWQAWERFLTDKTVGTVLTTQWGSERDEDAIPANTSKALCYIDVPAGTWLAYGHMRMYLFGTTTSNDFKVLWFDTSTSGNWYWKSNSVSSRGGEDTFIDIGDTFTFTTQTRVYLMCNANSITKVPLSNLKFVRIN